MRGTALTVPRDTLPPLGEGEYYHADLHRPAGRDARGRRGRPRRAIENFGAGDVLEIEKPDGKRFMVPMRPEAVPEWDAARLVVAPEYVKS